MSQESDQRVAPLGYAPALDGVRAVAVTAVLLFHSDATFASGGFLGVSVFFTVSGFLVASLLLDEHAATGTIDLGTFMARRARRLVPAAWACVALVVVSVPFWSSRQLDRLGGDVIAALANVSNWRATASETSYQDLFDSSPSPLAHFWSLAIEMQFYVALPIVAAATLRTGGARRFVWVVVGLLAASLASIALTVDFDLAYNGTHTRAAELLVGVLLAVVLFHARKRDHRLSLRSNTVIGTSAMTGLAVLVLITSIRSEWLVDGGLVLVAVLSCGLIIASVGPGLVTTALVQPWLIAIGKVSYGIYLFHWPIFLVLSPERVGLSGPALFVLRLAVTAALTVGSARLLEMPIRRGQRLNAVHTAGPVAFASVAALLLASLALPVTGGDDTAELLAVGADGLVRFDDQADDPRPEPTEAVRPLSDPGDQLVTLPDAPASTIAPLPPQPLRVLVVGSDTAALDVVVELAELPEAPSRRSIEVIDAVRPECAFVDAVEMGFDDRVVDVSQCASTSDTVSSALAGGTEPDLVIVAAGQLDSGTVRRADDVGFPTETMLLEVAERSTVTYQAVDDLVAEFDSAGIPIVMSWWGEQGLLDNELGRIAARRTSVTGYVRNGDALSDWVEREAAIEDDIGPLVRVLVLGDSTSLVLARALHDVDDRLDVLWAGANGCPIVRATTLHAGTGREPNPLDCPDFAVKLPRLLDDFDPHVVVVMPGTIALANLTFIGDDRPQVPGSADWVAYHDAEFAVLLDVLRPSAADRSAGVPAVLIADSPAIKRGPFSPSEMVLPERVAAVNAQIARWAVAHDGVDILDYAGPLTRYEAEFGSIRPDEVHPAAIELTGIAAAWFVDPVLAAATGER